MKTRFAVLLTLAAGLFGHYSAAAAQAPAGLDCSIKLKSDVSYGTDPLQKMDIYFRDALRGAPVILMVHGGGWSRGDKTNPQVVINKANHWVPNGYVFISINYRMLPELDPIAQADDVARAVATAQRKAAQWGGDPTRFILIGHSAGAHLVSLLAADPTIAARRGATPWKGTIALDSAVYDVPLLMKGPHLPLYDQAFGADPAYWRQASPFFRLTGTALPFLAVCSSNRSESLLQSALFVQKLKASGARAERLPVAMTHREINEELGLPSDYTRKVDRFLRSLL